MITNSRLSTYDIISDVYQLNLDIIEYESSIIESVFSNEFSIILNEGSIKDTIIKLYDKLISFVTAFATKFVDNIKLLIIKFRSRDKLRSKQLDEFKKIVNSEDWTNDDKSIFVKGSIMRTGGDLNEYERILSDISVHLSYIGNIIKNHRAFINSQSTSYAEHKKDDIMSNLNNIFHMGADDNIKTYVASLVEVDVRYTKTRSDVLELIYQVSDASDFFVKLMDFAKVIKNMYTDFGKRLNETKNRVKQKAYENSENSNGSGKSNLKDLYSLINRQVKEISDAISSSSSMVNRFFMESIFAYSNGVDVAMAMINRLCHHQAE